MSINVTEIFGPTIQGEGPKAGIKTIFVRVVGCDFKCSWCDSKFAWAESENSRKYSDEELIDELRTLCNNTNTRNVVLTGGNPCLYNFSNVISKLKDDDISFDVETQGSKFPAWLLMCNTIVISPKAPSSHQPNVFENICNWLSKNYNTLLKNKTNIAIKIPVFNNEDFEFARTYHFLTQSNLNIKLYLSVGNDNVDEKGDIAERILRNYKTLIEKVMQSDMKYVYILPQIHTLVWGNKQGV